MPSATYFFSTAKKSKQKMPLSNAEGLAQRERGTTGRLSGQFNRFQGNTPCCGLHS